MIMGTIASAGELVQVLGGGGAAKDCVIPESLSPVQWNELRQDPLNQCYNVVLTDNGMFCCPADVEVSPGLRSMHAVQASGADKVRFAGQILVLKSPGDVAIAVSNRSITYLPNPALVPLLMCLFEINFPGLKVHVLKETEEEI